MKKIIAAIVAVSLVFGIALNNVNAQEVEVTTTSADTTYELTTTDNAIINKFAEKIEEVVAEKGEAFRTFIVDLINTLSEHEKATVRVKAVFVKLAKVVSGEETMNPESMSGTVETGSTMSGDVMSGSTMTGDNMSGSTMSGDVMTGSTMTGDNMTGSTGTGA